MFPNGNIGIIRWLFDTSMGPPGAAGHWAPILSALFFGASFVGGVAFLVVPAVVVTNWSNRRDGITNRQLWSILVVFPAMGLCRIVRLTEIWGPPYRLTTIMDLLCAGAAAYAAWQFPRLLNHILMLPSRDQMHDALNRLNNEQLKTYLMAAELEERNILLSTRLDRLEHVLGTEGWTHEKAVELAKIRSILASSSSGIFKAMKESKDGA